MQDSERRRIMLGFGALGCLALVLTVRLVHLQGSCAGEAQVRVTRQVERTLQHPAPRGTIVDRHGRLLAYDRPVVEVRAELRFEGSETEDRVSDALAAPLVDELIETLGAPREAARRAEVTRELLSRVTGRRAARRLSVVVRKPRGGQPARLRHTVDFLVAADVETSGVLERLRELDRRRSDLDLHFLHRYERCYPDREFTTGVVGFVGDRRRADGSNAEVYRGMESFAGLQPTFDGWRKFFQDSRARQYWSARRKRPASPNVLQCTLDLELQKEAHVQLQRAVDAVTEQYESPPQWGAVCVVEIETGEVMALASYRAGVHPKVAAFAPTQCLYPPGSVVKPLLFALAVERGVLDWDGGSIDCTPDSEDWWRPPGSKRRIHDEHPAGVLSPRQVIVQSSNIGAAQVGLMLGRGGLEEYLARYAWGTATATGLPGELDGVRTQGLRAMPERRFIGYAGPSLAIGYNYNVTTLQLARAYLTLLSGRSRDLRLFSRVVVEGDTQELPREPLAPRFLSVPTVARLCDAMAGVVSDAEHATGAPLHEELRGLGVPDGLIGGKTGTSEFEERREVDGRKQVLTVRSASFVGFAPVDAPRYLAVCVLQKDRARAFWGGRYAAPATGRLLLRALARDENPSVVQDRPVRVRIPGHNGADGGVRAADR